LNDSRASDLLLGRSYIPNVNTVASGYTYSGQEYNYEICYPGITFSTNDTGNLSVYMYVVIAPLNKTVTSIFQPGT
jgi:hypothetical protein